MHSMVQQQQQQPSQQRQQIDNDDLEQDTSSVVSRHRSQKPLLRRLYNYLREAWTGVKFSLGKYNINKLLRCIRYYLITFE